VKYFRIIDSFELSDKWYLGVPKTSDGTEVDPRLFTGGSEYKGEGLLQLMRKISKGFKYFVSKTGNCR
jgi:hypothetical protein